MATATVRLLDVMLDNEIDEDSQQKMLLSSVSNTLVKLFTFLLLMIVVVFVAFLPSLLYAGFETANIQALDTRSWKFFGALALGSLPAFLIPKLKKEETAYSESSMLLHELILDNQNVHKFIRGNKKSQAKDNRPPFILISGLARSGTTALTTLLFKSEKFHSPTYANMPFLLNPKFWRRFYKPKQLSLKERAHGDKVLFGYDTVEAFEEYFFKTFLNDNYIQTDFLSKHTISEEIFLSYQNFQDSFERKKNTTTYLAKNNNLVLRYQSLRDYDQTFLAVFLFRNPIDHAYSLLKQDLRFTKHQEEDPFVLKYMNWLGHFEFGKGHRTFAFASTNLKSHSRNTINYWLEIWIEYYEELLKIIKGDNKILLIEYSDFLKNPESVIKSIEKKMHLDLGIGGIDRFINRNNYEGELDSLLEKKALSLFELLRTKKTSIN